ncbi:FAD binding domain-containing protein [Irregularibacter muris]|uniref:FAD binding domain-containing protein n=1 Tax=Irregularibacter muris TaxID=1796619 RepID=A0AAE3HJQ4_9FIRM|nr:FAD binding domain-containing protein [Irregularibacter muris]MCR1900124.1 FAD binding domain-containing protein [Irregularibacter muris]
MIPFNFEYYKPTEVQEAVKLYERLDREGKRPVYYGGGTEIITMARMHNVYTEAVIDIKDIARCKMHQLKNGQLILGSALTLREISQKKLFPLLSMTAQRIADHTVQNKITLGGNLAGTIIYHETLLPLLVSNSHILVAGINGERKVLIKEIFDRRLELVRGEMIVQVIIDEKYLSLPYLHVKRTKNEKIDYPLITMVALKNDKSIHMAFAGLCNHPFRSLEMEDVLNNSSTAKDEKIKQTIESIPHGISNDISGSSEYRKFILHTMLDQAITNFRERD